MVSEKLTDKKTIGITAANEKVLTALVSAGLFGSEIEAAKFAMARAIDAGIGRGTSEGAGTKWNVGSIDPDGALKSVVEALYPEESLPYRLVEHLMNEGLQIFDTGDGLPPDVAGVLFAAEDKT
ncbi:MAG: hypothetical protein ACN4E6_18040 [Qipengyuania pacifica]|jgi:hypothetical protein|tara:strand:+ start:34796 stop:35167 length:372 start_codon:yes stop_codon:yes gene_type:complete